VKIGFFQVVYFNVGGCAAFETNVQSLLGIFEQLRSMKKKNLGKMSVENDERTHGMQALIFLIINLYISVTIRCQSKFNISSPNPV
jgi:hypothetical protein